MVEDLFDEWQLAAQELFFVLESGTGGGFIHQKLDAINRVLEYSK